MMSSSSAFGQPTSTSAAVGVGVTADAADAHGAGVAGGAGMDAVVNPFPEWSLQPRKETGSLAFSKRFPEYDGRGTIIAILDSGLDPNAGGLQVTSDGRRKVIDRIDASGAGDVDMSKIVEAKDGELRGATGRTLRLPADLPGNGQYRVGFKRAFVLYPRSLRDRIIKERLEKSWEPAMSKYKAEATKRQHAESGKTGGDSSATTGDNSSAGAEDSTGGDDPRAAKLRKENADAEVDALGSVDKKFRDNNGSNGDPGPVYDIVLHHTGEHWLALIDTSECGRLEDAVRLRPFREYGDVAYLTNVDRLNVSVNVYENGDVLEITSACSSHGTHVASIAAAHFPDEPQKDGLAPGAQIVSISIGDGRLHSMETGTAMARACMHLMKAEHYKVDVINMSYGEHSHWSNSGRIGDLMNEVVNKHGIVWVCSAGNDGPALSTVGTPPDISTNSVIGVGAYVSPEMMVALYSSREKLPGAPYTWTSRGPTIDGDRGITVCAPGGAITSVPQFTLRCSQLMNGTSMASPHVCGAIAQLMSGLKILGVPFSPFSVKRALGNSAKPLSHLCHYAQGHGLLQVEAAFDNLVKYADCADRDVRFAVTCNGKKGIHLRGSDTAKPVEVSIGVDPVFLDAENVDNERKISFNMKLSLSCQASWVHHPDHLDLMYVTRHFLAYIDPKGLSPGAHSAYIKAYDVKNPLKGPVFEIPITVVKPEPLVELPRPHIERLGLTFRPGDLSRTFVQVPEGATWAVIRARSNEQEATGKFVLHAVQLLPKLVVRTFEHQKMFSLQENADYTYAIPVRGGFLLEVCIAKWWANLGNVNISYSIHFHGVSPDSKNIFLHAADGITRIEVTSPLHSEEVLPEIKLKNLVQNYRPVETKTIPLGERDVLPVNRRVYELQCTYVFSVPKAAEITPNLPWLSDVLYESEFESQLWMLYNSHKQLIACGDAYPSKYSVKVDKEDYKIKVHVRSEKTELLEKLTDMPLLISTKLSATNSLDVYASHAHASTFGKKASAFTIAKGATVPFYVAPLANDKYCKNATCGQYLTGVMTLAKDDSGKKADTYPVKYILAEPFKSKNSGSGSSGGAGGNSNSASGKNKKTDAFQESAIEHKIGWVGKLDPDSDEAKSLFESLKVETAANQVQVRMARLNAMEVDKKYESLTDERAAEVLELCNFVLDNLRPEEILAHFAMKHDSRPEAADAKKEMERQRNWLLDALVRRGLALCRLGKMDEATETLHELMKYTDPASDSKTHAFYCIHAEKQGHFGRALKATLAQMDSKPGVLDAEQRAVRLMGLLGWADLQEVAKRSVELRYPSNFELF